MFVRNLFTLLATAMSLNAAPVIRVAPNDGADFRSVQKAIDAAPPGARIEVAAGVYRENILIEKSVALIGAGIGRTIVELPGDTAPTLEEHWEGILKKLEAMTLAELKTGAQKILRGKPSAEPFIIRGDHRVRVEGVQLVWVGPKNSDSSVIESLVQISEADVTLRETAILGSSADAVRAQSGARCEISKCWIAGNWGRGVLVGGGDSPARKAHILDCDIRNNYNSHIEIYHDAEDVLIRGNHLHGSAWFAIRPNSKKTVIADNAMYDNARSGLYCTGLDTVITNNLFYASESGGVTCWNGSRDLIAGNTFVGDFQGSHYGDYGVLCVGDAKPTVRDNIFVGLDYAVQSTAYGRKPTPTSPIGEPIFGRNLFWRNGTNIMRSVAVPGQENGVMTRVDPRTPKHAPEYDPGFVNGAERRYSLAANSRARAEGLGVADGLRAAANQPLHASEKAILPDGEGWGFKLWKKKQGIKGTDIEERLFALFERKKLAAQRVEISYADAFKDLHATLGSQYQSFKLKGIDWAAVGKELIPRAEKVKDDREFGLLVYELVARLEDSHASVGKGLVDPPAVAFPQWDPGLACLLDDRGRPVVYHLDPGKSAEQAGVKIGMTIVSVNGRPAAEVIKETMAQAKRYSGYSSERYLLYHAAQWFLRQGEKDALVKVVAEDSASVRQSFDLSATEGVRYLPRRPVALEGIRDSANVDWTMLKNGMGLIYVRRIQNDLIAQLDKAVAELNDAKGLIIDVRGNSGGGFDFNRAHRNFIADRTEEPDRPRFFGPMALLIDSRCISAGEGWGSWFIANKRARVFGTATAGASARKTTYELKNKLFKVTFPVKPYKGYLDRIIEHRGLEPDVAIRQTAKDLASGRDTVLEAAAAWLDKQIPAAR